MCSKALLQQITQEVATKAQEILGNRLREVILFGSYARGDADDESDIDIIILADVGDDEQSRPFDRELSEVSSEIGLETNKVLCILLYDMNLFKQRLPMSPFYRNVMNDGVKVYAA